MTLNQFFEQGKCFAARLGVNVGFCKEALHLVVVLTFKGSQKTFLCKSQFTDTHGADTVIAQCSDVGLNGLGRFLSMILFVLIV